MNSKQIEELIKKISLSMLKYEDGDMMLISDIMDYTNELNILLNDVKRVSKIINIIDTLLGKLLKGEKIVDSEDVLSDGIDLISSIVKSIKTSKGKAKELDEFLENDINNYESK
ncbi:MAG: hypothetical protein KAT05_16490, partial [Spirochaetes bacterium]|nr:hypothetical protein [Spirochaetota bacterium]